MTNKRSVCFCAVVVAALLVAARADAKDKNKKWVASWITAPQGTYAGVNAPRLANLAFPFDATHPPQANNQTMRIIVKPDVWGDTMRVRVSNVYGPAGTSVTFSHVAIGLQSFAGETVAGTNRTVTFGGSRSVTVPAGQRAWSDAVKLNWAKGDNGDGDDDADDTVSSTLEGRNLAVSIFIAGQSGPMTFHGTGLVESFLGKPNGGDRTLEDTDENYPYETPSFFFVDGIDVMMPSDTRVLVGAGSSSVDGSITTPGNNDRFLNWMSRMLHEKYGQHVSVVNAGIGGDVAAIPNDPSITTPCAPNPAAGAQRRPLAKVLPERFDNDVLGASGVTDVVFYAGTNDFGDNIPSCQSIDSLTKMVNRLHGLGINAIGSTLISNVHQNGTNTATYVAHDQINQFILKSGVFDSTADFYGATIDPNNIDPVSKFPVLRADYQIHSDPDGTPDFLHLGRPGAQAEAATLDLGFFAPSKKGKH
jgi:hypothetical protein